MASEHFRRSKLIRFIRDEERVTRETREQLERMGMNPDEYSEHRDRLLERLKAEFKIDTTEHEG